MALDAWEKLLPLKTRAQAHTNQKVLKTRHYINKVKRLTKILIPQKTLNISTTKSSYKLEKHHIMNQEIRTSNIQMKRKAALLDIKETQMKKNNGTSDNSKQWWDWRNRYSHTVGKYKLVKAFWKGNMTVYQNYKPVNHFWPQQFYP